MPPHHWTLLAALHPLLSHTLAVCYALHILSHPPRHRACAFALLCVPVCYAFAHHLSLSPWYALNDTFARMLYIWLAYMSYAFLLVRVGPGVGNDVVEGGWGGRVRWAGKVLYTRHLGEYCTGKEKGSADTDRALATRNADGEGLRAARSTVLRRRRETPHHLTGVRFCLRHLAKAVLFLAINHAYDVYLPPPTLYPPPPFFRRLPASLGASELKLRAMMTWDTCVADMLYFEAVYSVFAVLWVGVFRFDAAAEWSLGVFGPLEAAGSVRAYWGAYWHDFIGASFSAHGEVVTRRWLRMGRGGARRVLENGLVFGASGVMHALVRYVQTGGQGEVWTEAMWYGAQMLPIVVEGVVQHVWSGSRLRRRSQALLGESLPVRVENAVGYAWVVCWMFWSVSKSLLTRHAWELDSLRRRYPELFADRGEHMRIDLERGRE